MLFVIYGFDDPAMRHRRTEHYPAHRTFLADAAAHGVTIVTSGPLVEDDGTTPIGSLIIIDAHDRAAAEAFHHADPFFSAGLWRTTTVTAFDKKRG